MSDRKKREASLPPIAINTVTNAVVARSPAVKSVSLTPVHVPGKATPYPRAVDSPSRSGGRSRAMSMPPSSSPLKNMVRKEPFDVIPSSPVKSILKKLDTPIKDKTAKVLFANDKLPLVSPSSKSPLKKKQKKEKKAEKKKNKGKNK
ncbi:hypothetical protein QBC40DRAFT_156150, partial [Triangularia verruculosa]